MTTKRYLRGVFKSKRAIWEIVICACGIVCGLCALLMDFSILPVPSFAIIKIRDVESFMSTLFSIQASISTLGIAIISIVTGVMTESIYGISVSEYVTHLKPYIFKHEVIITAGLFITALNFLCLSFAWFNLSITIFFVSIALNTFLFQSTYLLLLGKEKIKKQIREYILNNYDGVNIRRLYLSSDEALSNSNYLVLKDNFEVILLIIQNEIKNTTEVTKESLLENIEIMVGELFEKIVKTHEARCINEGLLLISEIYDLANQKEPRPVYLQLWTYISEDYYKGIKDLSFNQLRDDYAYLKIGRKIYKNLGGTNSNIIQSSNVRSWSAWTYRILLHDNNHLLPYDKERLLRAIYMNSQFALPQQDEAIDDLGKIAIYGHMLLHKAMIDEGEKKELANLYFKNYWEYEQEKIAQQLISVITLAYLYYLAYREGRAQDKPIRDYAKEILRENSATIKDFYYRVDVSNLVEQYYDFLQNTFRHWEYWGEERGKNLIADTVLDDFLLFSVLNDVFDPSKIEIVVKKIASQGMVSLYMQYFSDVNYQYLHQEYQQFCEAFSSITDDISLTQSKFDALREICDKMYREEIVTNSQNGAISETNLESVRQQIQDIVGELISDKLGRFKEKEKEDTKLNCVLLGEKIWENDIPVALLGKLGIQDYYARNIREHVMCYILGLIDSGLVVKPVFNDERNIQKQLIDYVEKNHVFGNVFVGRRERFWMEDNPTLLKEYTEGMKQIKDIPHNYLYILDGEAIEIKINNFEVKFSDIPWEEIKAECQEDGGKIKYPVCNGICIPFEKTQLETYVHNTKRRVTLFMDIHIRTFKEIVGAGVHIILNRK